MTDTNQLQQDLHYVRDVVVSTERLPQRRVAIYCLWALYVLIGFPLRDFAPRFQGPFFMIGWVVCAAASAYLMRRYKKMSGVRKKGNRSGLFWFGGSVLLILCSIGISIVAPQIPQRASGQITVILIGLFYFLAGVHYDRNFLWLGPVLCVAGVLVGFVPHYGWTALGIVFALGLVVPSLFTPRPPTQIQQSNLV